MTSTPVPPASMPDVRELQRDFLLSDGGGRMFYVDGAEAPRGLPCVIAIGAFDGFHRGHQDLLARAAADAASRGVATVAVTFDPDPDEVLSAHPAHKLLSFDDRVRVLLSTGAHVAVVPFTPALAELDHDAFFSRVLAPALDIQAIHVGTDFRLGRCGASTVEVMQAWGAQHAIEVHGHALLEDDGAPITATRIRTLFAQGSIEMARRELGRRPLLRGTVQHGRGQGTDMGFPTANMALHTGIQLPANGVYAGLALIDDSVWPAAINAGLPPMFDSDAHSAHLEANLLGCTGDLYGKDIAIAFDRRLRPSRKFESIDALIETVNNDIQTVRGLFGDTGVRLA